MIRKDMKEERERDVRNFVLFIDIRVILVKLK